MNEKDLVPQDDTQSIIQAGQERIDQYNQLARVAIKHTRESDWHRFGDTAYLKFRGAQKFAATMGLSIHDIHIESEKDEIEGRPVVFYTAWVSVSMGDRTLTEMGTASTNDPFFAKRGGQLRPLSEIDRGAVKKKSLSNAMNRAIQRFLGLSFDWDQVMGILKGDNKPTPPKRGENSSPRQEVLQPTQKKKLADNLMAKAPADEGEEKQKETAQKMLEGYSERALGRIVKSFSDLSDEEAATILAHKVFNGEEDV